VGWALPTLGAEVGNAHPTVTGALRARVTNGAARFCRNARSEVESAKIFFQPTDFPLIQRYTYVSALCSATSLRNHWLRGELSIALQTAGFVEVIQQLQIPPADVARALPYLWNDPPIHHVQVIAGPGLQVLAPARAVDGDHAVVGAFDAVNDL